MGGPARLRQAQTISAGRQNGSWPKSLALRPQRCGKVYRRVPTSRWTTRRIRKPVKTSEHLPWISARLRPYSVLPNPSYLIHRTRQGQASSHFAEKPRARQAIWRSCKNVLPREHVALRCPYGYPGGYRASLCKIAIHDGEDCYGPSG